MVALRFAVFLGSCRENRLGARVAKYVIRQIQDRGHSVEFFDPQEIALPILRKPLHFYGKATPPESLVKLNEKIVEADAIVVVSGEYNHSIPPALSNLMDHFPGSSFGNKPSGIVTYSPGSYGGMRAAMALRPFLGEIGCISVSAICGIPKASTVLDENGYLTGDENAHSYLRGTCLKMIEQVEWWGEAAKFQREKTCKASK